MNDTPISDRATYNQRHGGDPLPSPMKHGELSPDIRREIDNIFTEIMDINRRSGGGYLTNSFKEMIRSVLGRHQKVPYRKISTGSDDIFKFIAEITEKSEVKDLLSFIELFIDENEPIAEIVELLFKHHQAPFVLLKNASGYWRFHPITFEAEGEAILKSIGVLRDEGYSGANEHLSKASEDLNAGDFAGCVRESIHAVESVARIIINSEKTTLGKALKILKTKGIHIHPALEKGMNNLYGYTSDEEGVRHALLEEGANVDKYTAMYMFGACASFAAYLVNKHRESNTEKE